MTSLKTLSRMQQATVPVVFGPPANADTWAVTARPLIEAYLAVEDAKDPLYQLDSYLGRSIAIGALDDVLRELRDYIEAIRDDALADMCPPQPADDAPEAEWDDRDEFNDELARNTVSVETAILNVEREMARGH